MTLRRRIWDLLEPDLDDFESQSTWVDGFLVTLILLALRYPARMAIQTGFVLAQVGEFSFLVLKSAQNSELILTLDANPRAQISIREILGGFRERSHWS